MVIEALEVLGYVGHVPIDISRSVGSSKRVANITVAAIQHFIVGRFLPGSTKGAVAVL